MRTFTKTIPILSLIAGLTACSPYGSSSGSDQSSNQTISFTSSSNYFESTQSPIKSSSMEAGELAAVLKCEEPSTETRMEKDTYTIAQRTFQLHQATGLGNPTVFSEERMSFQTANSGQTSVQTYELLKNHVNTETALPNGPISYSEKCSASEGCDKDSRRYNGHDRWYLINHNGRLSDLADSSSDVNPHLNCEFAADQDAKEVDDTFTEGKITIGEKTYAAVRYVRIVNGNLVCNDIEAATATQTTIEIVIADKLPKISLQMNNTYPESSFATAEIGRRQIGCTRTRVYSSSAVASSEKGFLQGQATEMASYGINGEVPSVEEFEEQNVDLSTRLANLQDSLRIASQLRDQENTRKQAADAQAATKATSLIEAETNLEIAERAKNSLTEDATDEEKNTTKAAVEEAQARLTRATIESQAAQTASDRATRAYVTAEEALGRAQRELVKFQEEHPEIS